MPEKLNIQHKKLVVAIDNATIIQDTSSMKESLKDLENVDSTLSDTIQCLKWVNLLMMQNNKKKAVKIYKEYFFKTSNKKLRVKRRFTIEQIEKYLNNSGLLKKTINKLEKAQSIVKKVLGPAKALVKACEMVLKAKNVIKDISHLSEAQEHLKTAEDYRKYYGELGNKFIEISGNMKSIASGMPAGIGDYCVYIFTVGQGCGVVFKLFNQRAAIINKESTALDKLRENIGSNKITTKSGREALQQKKGTTEQILDILFRMAGF